MKKINVRFSNVNDKKIILLVTLTIILSFGIYARIGHLFKLDINSPVYLGGLFAEFAQQIYENGFAIPKTIPFYTEGGIPFGYPPLPFYLLTVLIHVLNLSVIPTLNILSPILAIISLISFWFLSKEVFNEEPLQLLSTLFFAALPIAFREQIEAAGLAEASGTIAIIWLLFFFYKCKKTQSLKNSIFFGLFVAFSLVSSPGSAYSAVIVGFFFTINLISTKKINLLLPAIVVSIIGSSFYWIPVLNNHGIQVITNPFFDNHNGFLFLILQKFIQFILFRIIESSYFILNTLMIFGMIIIFEKRYYQILLFFLIFSILPREGKWLSSIPIALILGVGTQYLFSLIQKFSIRTRKFSFTLLSFWLLMALVIGVSNEHNLILTETDIHLSEDAKSGMNWVKNNLPQESYFIVLSSPNLIEWFPYFSRRTVLNVEYGAEWDLVDLNKINAFKNDTLECETFDCYKSASENIFKRKSIYYVVENINFDETPIYEKGEFRIYSSK